MEKERQEKDAKQQVLDPKSYTIFHAIVETLEKKEKGKPRRCRLLSKLRLSK
ncbi:MAG: hypothetical protein ACUVRA_02500 [Candidatus Bathyarchaeaceae archaeon]